MRANKMETQLRKDLRTLQTRMGKDNASEMYKKLRVRMIEFMNLTNRTWSNSLIYLLNAGLDAEDADRKLLEKIKAEK